MRGSLWGPRLKTEDLGTWTKAYRARGFFKAQNLHLRPGVWPVLPSTTADLLLLVVLPEAREIPSWGAPRAGSGPGQNTQDLCIKMRKK